MMGKLKDSPMANATFLKSSTPNNFTPMEYSHNSASRIEGGTFAANTKIKFSTSSQRIPPHDAKLIDIIKLS